MKKIRINPDIYSLNSIERTRTAYMEYAKIKVQQNGSDVIIIFTDCRYDEDQTVKEFENYLIGLENAGYGSY